MRKIKEKQDVQDSRLAILERDIYWIKEEVTEIKEQVSNHLVTQIKELQKG